MLIGGAFTYCICIWDFSNHGLEMIVMFYAALVKSAAWTYLYVCLTQADFYLCVLLLLIDQAANRSSPTKTHIL